MDKKRLTLEDFIQKSKRKEVDTKKFKPVYIESLDGEVVIQKINLNTVLEAMDNLDTNDSMRNVLDQYAFLIYESIPILKSKELQEQYQLVEPTDIVTEIFELDEIFTLGSEILSLYGLDKLGETVKNS